MSGIRRIALLVCKCDSTQLTELVVEPLVQRDRTGASMGAVIEVE